MSDFINKPELKDCSINTLIKYIPNIINDNNKEVKRVFNDIFEFGNGDENNLQYIKTSVNTKGVVKGNSGQFYNLFYKTINIDASSAQKDFLNVVTNHQYSQNRFKEEYENNITTSYSHDAANIYYLDANGNSNVNDALNNLQKTVKEVDTHNTNNEAAINLLDASIKELYNILSQMTSKLNIEKEATVNENYDDLVDVINNGSNSYTYSNENYN